MQISSALFKADKTCPACKTRLDQPDDVVLSSLNPSSDYRTSVLAGLAPDVIIDIAARSLAFWQYQQSQEAAFQSMLLKSAQERNALLEKRYQSTVVEARGELTLLQQKLSNAEKELANEKRRTRELQEALRAATRDYERLKQQQRRSHLVNVTAQQAISPLFAQPVSRPPESAPPAAMQASLWQSESGGRISTTTGQGLEGRETSAYFEAGAAGQNGPTSASQVHQLHHSHPPPTQLSPPRQQAAQHSRFTAPAIHTDGIHSNRGSTVHHAASPSARDPGRVQIFGQDVRRPSAPTSRGGSASSSNGARVGGRATQAGMHTLNGGGTLGMQPPSSARFNGAASPNGFLAQSAHPNGTVSRGAL